MNCIPNRIRAPERLKAAYDPSLVNDEAPCFGRGQAGKYTVNPVVDAQMHRHHARRLLEGGR
jgi:hypothetical protein